MPLGVAHEDRKLLLTGAAILLLIVLAALFLAPPEAAESEVPSTYSAASQGAKAAYLLLQESGYRVERWEQSPVDLPAGTGVTLLLVSPSAFPNAQEQTKMRDFVAGGGRLIAVGALSAIFLPEHKIRPDPLAGSGWTRFKALLPAAAGRVAPVITMAPQGFWESNSAALPLYGDGHKVVAVRYRFGQGDIIWWGGPTPLTNAGLREPGNLEFFLTCIGDRQNTRVLWDEYFHGHRRSLAATLAHTQIKWMFVQFGLVVLGVLLTYSRRRGPVRPAVMETRLSPLEFVETLGGLYERSKAGAVAVEVYQQRFRYWLTRRLGIAGNASIEDLEHLTRDRWQFEDSDFGATLRRCESARYEHDLPPKEALRLVQALHGFATRLKLFPASPEEKH